MSLFKIDPGSNFNWKNLGTAGSEWRFVSEEIPVNSVLCGFSLLRCSMSETGAAARNGDLAVMMLPLAMSGTANDDVIHTDMACTAESLIAVMSTPFNDVEAAFQELSFSSTEAYNAINLGFIDPHIALISGQGLVCTFEPMEITINEVINMADMQLSFKEQEFFATGENTFVYIELKAEKIECQMYDGVLLEAGFEELDLSLTGSVGIIAKLNLKGRPMTLEAKGGDPPKLGAEFIPLSFEGLASFPISARLSPVFKKPLCEFFGTTPLGSFLDVRFGLMSINLDGNNNPVGNMALTFSPIRASMEAAEIITADLEAEISLLRLKANMLTDGPNDMVIEFPKPVVKFDDDGGDCAIADTLTYGGQECAV